MARRDSSRKLKRRVKRYPKRDAFNKYGSFNKNSMRREVAVGLGY